MRHRKLLLLGAVALLSAGAAGRWLGSEGSARPALAGAAGPPSAAAQAPGPEPAAPERRRSPRRELGVVLVGTFASSTPSLSQATLYDPEQERSFVVGIGDRVAGRATVLRVEPGRLVLREDGVERELLLSPGQRRSGERPFEAALRDVERAIREHTARQARVLPHVEDGALAGLHVSAIQPGSRFEEMGIEEGDVITQFNGVAIDSPAGAIEALERLSGSEQHYNVLALRGDRLEYLHGLWSDTGH